MDGRNKKFKRHIATDRFPGRQKSKYYPYTNL